MDGLLCEEKQLIRSRFNLMSWKAYYLLFQKAVPFRRDWSKEPALSCLRHWWNSTRILCHRSGFIIIMLPLGAAGSLQRIESFGVVFVDIKLNTGGVKGKDLCQSGINHLADGFYIIHHLLKQEFNIRLKVLFTPPASCQSAGKKHCGIWKGWTLGCRNVH